MGRPMAPFELDQRHEFAQVMGVAERVAEAFEPAVGLEPVVHDHAADQVFGDVAALWRHAIEGQGVGGDGVQPMAAACDAEAGLVEAAHRRGRSQRCDAREDWFERSRLFLHPVRQSVRAEADSAEQVGERLGDPVLGNDYSTLDRPPPLAGARHIAPARSPRPGTPPASRNGNRHRRRSRPGAPSPGSAARAGRRPGAPPRRSALKLRAPPGNGGTSPPRAGQSGRASPPAAAYRPCARAARRSP